MFQNGVPIPNQSVMMFTPHGNRLSEDLPITVSDPYMDIRRALSAIDKVHGIAPALEKPVPLVGDANIPGFGRFRNDSKGWFEIAINPYTPAIQVSSTVVHEIGHLLDAKLAGFKGYASDRSKSLAGWRRAVRETESVKSIIALENVTDGHIVKNVIIDQNTVKYLLREHELFARSYVQYVTLRSGDSYLQKWLDVVLQSQPNEPFSTQWGTDDFDPVAKELDDIFETLTWIKR